MATHTVTIKVQSDNNTPNWFVEKVISEAVNNTWKHSRYGNVKGLVQKVERHAEPTLYDLFADLFG